MNRRRCWCPCEELLVTIKLSISTFLFIMIINNNNTVLLLLFKTKSSHLLIIIVHLIRVSNNKFNNNILRFHCAVCCRHNNIYIGADKFVFNMMATLHGIKHTHDQQLATTCCYNVYYIH